MTYMLLLNCALKLVEEIILYYDARSKKHQNCLMECQNVRVSNFQNRVNAIGRFRKSILWCQSRHISVYIKGLCSNRENFFIDYTLSRRQTPQSDFK